jgi:deferrochelatase/peroxidase EfeB
VTTTCERGWRYCDGGDVDANKIDLRDVQGIAFYAYSKHPHSRYLLVTFAYDDPRTFAWLRAFVSEVRHAQDAHDFGKRKVTPDTIHVAFTARGLLAFGLAPGDLDAFPREYLLGMNEQERAKILGDTPTEWTFGGPQHDEIHAVVMLFARTEEGIAALAASHRERLAEAGARIHDGISEPHVAGGPRETTTRQPSLPAGEILLGHEDAYGEITASPVVRGFDFGRNGTFVVYRTLAQRVADFWASMRKNARPDVGESAEDSAVRLASSVVGRWPGGAPIVLHPRRPPDGDSSQNDFNYAKVDPTGARCPLGAHARRGFPRDMLAPSPDESLKETGRHRLFRRGRPFGAEREKPPWEYDDDGGVDRGLVFIALCASLRRQFEFIQQTWVNNSKFGELYDERDPMVADSGGCFTVQGAPVRRCLALPQFVEMRGGAYFFLPGLHALAWLAKDR